MDIGDTGLYIRIPTYHCGYTAAASHIHVVQREVFHYAALGCAKKSDANILICIRQSAGNLQVGNGMTISIKGTLKLLSRSASANGSPLPVAQIHISA